MREIILGTAGHVDHGKTSLIRALTGIDTDRLKEEKERGITIELGFAHLDLPCGHRLGIVDVPGHEKFVRNMVAGAAGMDLVAFVIAADEGIMPQTTEHFEICRLLGIKDGIIVLTKKDMVDEEWLEMVEEDVREHFRDTFLDDCPIIAVSSTTGEGIDELRAVLDKKIGKIPLQEEFGPFRLAVDRVFTMKGFGTVITGSSINGRIMVGDDLEFHPSGLTAKIRGIQVHGGDVELVEAGHRTAINLQGIEKEQIRRGDMAATPGSLTDSTLLDCDFHYLASNPKPIRNRVQVRVHVGTREVTGRLVFLEEDILQPGDNADIQIILQEPVALWPGDRYVIRSYSPVRTIGGGTVLNNDPPKRKRTNPEDRQRNHEVFARYREGSDQERLLLFLEDAGHRGLTRDQVATRIGIFGKRLQKLLQRPLSRGEIIVADSDRQWMISGATLERLCATVLATLTDFHNANPLKPGLAREELRSGLKPPLEPRLFQYVIDTLIKRGEVVQDQAELRRSDFEVTLRVDEQKLREDILTAYREKGLTPPNLKDLLLKLDAYPEKQVREVLNLLLQDKKLIKINESLIFDADQLEQLAVKVTDHIRNNGEIDAQGFKKLTGLTRKFSIPLLEYFDKIKITIRIGDKRVLRGEAN